MYKFNKFWSSLVRIWILTLVLFILPNAVVNATTKGLVVNYIDVGQADSCLIQTDGHNMLIDAGNRDDGIKVINYLKSHGVKKLDFVIGTHPHEDHIGGMAQILNTFSSDKIIMPKVSTNTETFKNLLITIQKLNKKIITPVPGTRYRLGDSEFTILSPNSSKYEDLNNYSVVIKLVYKNTSFIFEGDAEGISENEILSKGFNIKADVIKIGHHGSRSSSSEAYLEKVNPKYAIISCGAHNDYGHPHQETLDKLNALKIKLYRTDINGTIVCTSDGKKLNFTTDKNLNELNSKIVNNAIENSLNSSKIVSNDNVIVYITKTGTKYHKDDCRTLKGKRYPITLKQAKLKGYLPCKICSPPE